MIFSGKQLKNEFKKIYNGEPGKGKSVRGYEETDIIYDTFDLRYYDTFHLRYYDTLAVQILYDTFSFYASLVKIYI